MPHDPSSPALLAEDAELELGEDVNERVGTSSGADVAWFATAFPLLAWERERGWERGPAVPVNGEMAVSEDFSLDVLDVVAPSAYQVLGTGPFGQLDVDSARATYLDAARRRDQ